MAGFLLSYCGIGKEFFMGIRTTRSSVNSNFKAVKSKLMAFSRDIDNAVKNAMEEALREIAKQIFEKSQEYAPMDEGHLRESAKIHEIQWEGNVVKTSISYGNEKVNYAFFVHEDMPSAVSPKKYTTDGTGPKYLQRAVEEIFTDENVRKVFLKAIKNKRGRT